MLAIIAQQPINVFRDRTARRVYCEGADDNKQGVAQKGGSSLIIGRRGAFHAGTTATHSKH